MSSKLRWPLLGLILVTMASISGCGGRVERSVTFYDDEEWKAEIVMEAPLETMALVGGTAAIEEQLNTELAKAEAIGVNSEWRSRRQDTMIIYEIELSGTGYDTLTDAAFDGGVSIEAVEVEGERTIVFSERATSNLFGADNETLTLIGGEVLSTNGTRLGDDKVQWVDWGGSKNAVLTAKGGFGFGSFLLILVALGALGAVVAAGAGGGLFLLRKRSTAPASGHCPHCGTQLDSGAKFCFKCGQPRT